MELDLSVDHVTVAGRDLDGLNGAFADLGLEPYYGGPHSNGVTHMSILGFADGSYVELISKMEPDAESPIWDEHIRRDGGPCGWALESNDITGDAEELADNGADVEGPIYYDRQRPDGVTVEWDLVFLGGGEPGATLPFLIEDRTPRDYRVPSESVLGGELVGVDKVILGVEDLEGTVSTFSKLFGLPNPSISRSLEIDATLASFEGTPIVLATPAHDRSPLADRLDRLGDSPCAFLLGTDDWDASRSRFDVDEPEELFERQVGWIDSDRLRGIHAGIIG